MIRSDSYTTLLDAPRIACPPPGTSTARAVALAPRRLRIGHAGHQSCQPVMPLIVIHQGGSTSASCSPRAVPVRAAPTRPCALLGRKDDLLAPPARNGQHAITLAQPRHGHRRKPRRPPRAGIQQARQPRNPDATTGRRRYRTVWSTVRARVRNYSTTRAWGIKCAAHPNRRYSTKRRQHVQVISDI